MSEVNHDLIIETDNQVAKRVLNKLHTDMVRISDYDLEVTIKVLSSLVKLLDEIGSECHSLVRNEFRHDLEALQGYGASRKAYPNG